MATGRPPRPRRLSGASLVSVDVLQANKPETASPTRNAAAPAVNALTAARKGMPPRAQSYTPGVQPVASSSTQPPKKRKNLGAKIDAWWSAVTKSFVPTPSAEREKGPTNSPSASMASMRRTSQSQTVSSTLSVPPSSADAIVGRTSAQFPRETTSTAQGPALRHVSSATELQSPQKAYIGGHPPSGALAPAARITKAPQQVKSLEPPAMVEGSHSRVNSIGSEGDGSSGSGSNAKIEFRRRNPQLSLKLDPRYQPAGITHKLSDKTSHGSSSLSSTSGGPAHNTSQTFFKEPRPPMPQHRSQPLPHEQTPSLTPGQSPLWAQTPGLVPLSGPPLKVPQPASKQSLAAKTPSPAALAPTFSVSHIRDHIKHRLSGAKHSCDKELRKIVNGITVYVENELENERAFASHDSRQEPLDLEDELRTRLSGHHTPVDSDVGNDAEDELDRSANANQRAPLVRRDTDSSTSGHNSRQSRVSSPNASLQQPRWPSSASNRGRTSGTSSPRRFSMQSKRPTPNMPLRPGELAARLEKSLNIDQEAATPLSRSSSRSTSRSRSPMPNLSGISSSQRGPSADLSKQHARHGEESEKQRFLSSLQSMVSIAQEILDTSVSDLTADPSTCAQLIRRVQQVGKQWDDHPSWPLRGWYVQLLLAVAGLSRVSEFWAEERGFWNFENDDKDENDVEPIMFVAKAQNGPDSEPTSSARSRAPSVALHNLGRGASKQDASTPPTSLGLDLGVHRVEEESVADDSMRVAAPILRTADISPEADEAENLREAVEEVRNATILMELALDGDSFQYLSPVWNEVVG